MDTFQMTDSVNKLAKWLVPKKFCFIFSLKTGIQFYCFSSFITGVIITNMLLIKLIDQQPNGCKGYYSASDLVFCPDVVKLPSRLDNPGLEGFRNVFAYQIILLHTSLAFLSALLLYLLKWPALPLYWSGGKVITATAGLCYLPEWGRKILLEFFNFHIHSTWLAVFLIVLDFYGILVALGYYSELVGSTSTPDMNNDTSELPDPDMILHPLSS